MLNLVETLHKLVREDLDPLNVLLLHLEECFANLALPFGDDMDVGRVLNDGLRRVLFNFLELFQLLLVLLVDVVQVLSRHQALEALILLKLSREECRWRLVRITVDSEGAFRELLLSIHQESIVDDVLFDVALHVARCFLLLVLVDECFYHVEGGRIVFPPSRIDLHCTGTLFILLHFEIAAVAVLRWL